LSKPFAKSTPLVCLAGRLTLALPLAGSLGCWEEIRYEPAPEVVQSTVGEKTASPEEPAGEGAAAPAVEGSETPPAEPAPAAGVVSESVAEPSSPPLETPPLELPAQPAPEAESTAGELFGESSTDSAATSPAATTAAVPAATPAQRLLIWQAAGKWSLAAAMNAKQLPAERYEPIRSEADAAAAELGVTLPPLPLPKSDQTPEQAVIEALAGEPAASVVAAASDRFGPAAGALAELAIRSHLLLLTYSPRRDDAVAQAADFTAVAKASGLPPDDWEPLAKLLSDRGEYVAVRTAIFEFYRRVESALAEASR
jgi:hypothetical protein